ncbi:hypothetical protein PGIGA_G00160400 [Pangasianodon gigas]|uniref:Uncharacterized protein n=1 Tax=Pangasianodon gigas TaxID=30993 RepID=A0ACC5XRE7_PANGG|nr:hypothetical protein [Pangasianodon gigas]
MKYLDGSPFRSENVRVALLDPSVEILRVVSNTWGNSLVVNAHALTQQKRDEQCCVQMINSLKRILMALKCVRFLVFGMQKSLPKPETRHLGLYCG